MQLEKNNIALLYPEILEQLLEANLEMNVISIGGDLSSDMSIKLAHILQKYPQVNTLELNETLPLESAKILADKIIKNPHILYIYIHHEFSIDRTIAFVKQLSQTKNKKIIYIASTNKKLKNVLTKLLSQSVLELQFIK